MPMFLHDPLQTMARAYEEICAGEEPWVALGNFTNDWFIYASHRRAEMIAEPLVQPEEPTLEEWRWAVFIAASVEYLCECYVLPCPIWARDKRYALAEPWYHAIYVPEEVRVWLEETTPESFKRRNIYCGDRIYMDKREVLSHYYLDVSLPSQENFL